MHAWYQYVIWWHLYIHTALSEQPRAFFLSMVLSSHMIDDVRISHYVKPLSTSLSHTVWSCETMKQCSVSYCYSYNSGFQNAAEAERFNDRQRESERICPPKRPGVISVTNKYDLGSLFQLLLTTLKPNGYKVLFIIIWHLAVRISQYR